MYHQLEGFRVETSNHRSNLWTAALLEMFNKQGHDRFKTAQ